MYAIVEIGGLQWKAEEAKVLRVPKMNIEPGKSVNLDQVLLLVDKENVQIGTPVLKGAQIQAKVLSHGKDKKVMVFKKKRRKDYKVKKGHRQEYTEIQIEKIVAKAAKTAAKPAASKTETKPKAEKAAPKKPAAKTEKSGTAEMKTGKPAGKKPAIQKAAPKKSTTPVKPKAAPKKKADSSKKEG